MQVTVAVEVPGRLVPGFQVQRTTPPALAVSVEARWLLVEADPEAYTTRMVLHAISSSVRWRRSR